MCNKCGKIYRTISQERFLQHRFRCSNNGDTQDNMDLDSSCSHPDHVDNGNQNVIDENEAVRSLDIALMKFFVTANIPFKQVENKYFLDFLQAVHDSKINYKPPSRHALATSVLAKLHREITEKKKRFLSNTDSVIIVDSWKNKSKNKKYLSFTLRNINTPQTFLTFFDVTTEKEDGEHISTKINEAIRKAKQLYDTNVYAIVTDNDAKIIKAGRLAKTVDQKSLIQSTCSSHSSNLLMKSLVTDEFTFLIRDIVTTFKDSKLEAFLISRGGTKLRTLVETRFCYLRDACISILKNLFILKVICRAENRINSTVKDQILSEHFQDQLVEVINIMDPMCKLLNFCQSPECNIADSTELWVTLSLPTNEFDEVVSSRKDKSIWPVAYAANLLHHKYRGKHLDEAQKIAAADFLDESMDETIKQEYAMYLSTIQNFQFYAESCKDPISYWKFVGKKFPNLSKFVIKLMIIPASTALLESLFSNRTYIHNLQRNRLDDSKSAVLVDIYHSLIRESAFN